jgi:hypothetical protein
MSGGFHTSDATVSAHGAVAVVKSDSTIFPTTRGLYIGATGNLVVTMADGQTPITFASVAVGILPIQVTQVLNATTASSVVALY